MLKTQTQSKPKLNKHITNVQTYNQAKEKHKN